MNHKITQVVSSFLMRIDPVRKKAIELILMIFLIHWTLFGNCKLKWRKKHCFLIIIRHIKEISQLWALFLSTIQRKTAGVYFSVLKKEFCKRGFWQIEN